MRREDRGHCRHCHDECTGVSVIWTHTRQPRTNELTDGAYAVWSDGCCPMCAEGERIARAVELDALTLPVTQRSEPWDMCAAIARGEA